MLRHNLCKKEVLITGHFNINLLDFVNNKKVQSFVNLMFHCGMVPVINKGTRVTRYTATAVDHIFTSSIINTEIKSAIIKLTASIILIISFFKFFFPCTIHECFPKIKIKLKPQKCFRPLITLGIRRSSKRKQRL